MAAFDYTLHYRTWHNESAEHVAAVARFHARELHYLLPQWRDLPVLDIGCGMGFCITALQELGFTRVSGVDTDEGQAAACLRRGLDVQHVEDTVAFLRRQDAEYGMVLLLDVLEHVPVDGQIALARAIRQRLGPTGRLIVKVPNASSPVAARTRYIDYQHCSAFTEHSLRFVLRNAGFNRIQFSPGRRPGRRPPLRVREFRRWMVRKLWTQVLIAELGEAEADNVSLDLNLLALACPV
jgi:2-polyprenyl-3-methyl-5-hydroxy-6-metoxy-1,4-benzoquinol methylase